MLYRNVVLRTLSHSLTAGLVFGTLLLLSAQDLLPVEPRSDPAKYHGHLTTTRFGLGAELMPHNEAARFFTPLEEKYYVVEIAIYPSVGHIIELDRGDFRLRNDGKTAKAQNPHAVATFLTQTAAPEPGMETTSRRSESIGIRKETGRPTEVFQQQRTGVGISSGHYWTREDRETMYRELSALELPEGAKIQPVAGYLYFSIKNKGPLERMELIYRDGGESVIVNLR